MATFQTSDGLNIYFDDTGEGLPILCLPGLTRTTADFDYVTPHLAGNRLIKLDYRGRGQSDFDENWQNYNLQTEGRDVIELLFHLGLEKAAMLGTSRGGLIAMGLGVAARQHLLGIAFNDIGPAFNPVGLQFIMTYLGRDPAAKTHAEMAHSLAEVYTAFEDVPEGRWLKEAQNNYVETSEGLRLSYDPKLRDAVEASMSQEIPDLWAFFDQLQGLPLATVRGENSVLFTADTLAEMQTRRPDMAVGIVPGRGHAPFLDEPEAVAALQNWVEQMA